MKKNKKKLSTEQLSFILEISEKTIKKLILEDELPHEIVNRKPQFCWNMLITHFEQLEGGVA